MRFILLHIAFLFLISGCGEEPKIQPSIIIITADDQGWGDLSYNGNQDISTPNIDQIAQEGLVYNNFYVSPVCSPTRAEVLTGRYHFRSGVYGTSAGGERLNLDEITIAEVFQEAGYETGLFGKWHSGTQYPYHPNARGFEEFFGFCSGHWGHYFDPILEHNGELVKEEGYIADIFTNKAIDFIQQKSNDPFFIWLTFNTPHSPMQVPDAYWNQLSEDAMNQLQTVRDTQHTKAALAMVKNLDDNVGRILNSLKEQELDEETIVVYMTDNGPNGFRFNGNMKGIKGSTDEGGTRSPLFIRWKDQIKHQTVEKIAAAIDLFPTLTGMAGIEKQENLSWDGVDLRTSKSDRILVQHWNGRVSVRNQEYRLSHDNQLYHIKEDRAQSNPIQNEAKEVLDQLKGFKDSLITAIDWPNVEKDNRPFTIGPNHTLLPARDAQLRGEVQRSNRYPNSTYITQWKLPSDSILWDTEFLEKGTYEFTLHYTCKPEGLNSQIALNIGDQSTITNITKAHDPPVYGMESDRVPRIESYVKDFATVHIGTLTVEGGRNPIVLTVPQMMAPESIDIALIEVKRTK